MYIEHVTTRKEKREEKRREEKREENGKLKITR